MSWKERDERDIFCPRCGADAEWSFSHDDRSGVEIMCVDCGRFEMQRADFDRFGAEIAGVSETDEPLRKGADGS
jgi:hypothetical protein